MSTMLIAQIIKEFLVILRDKKTRIILIGPPLIQLFIFSVAITFAVSGATIAVYNQDTGIYSQHYIQELENSYMVKKILPIHSRQELKKTMDERKALLSVNIPENFSKKIASNLAPTLQVIADGRRSNAAQIALSYVSYISNDFLANEFSLKGGTNFVVERYWYNSNLSYKWYVVPNLSGMLAMIITLLLTGLSIAREREQGTFDQLLVSPIGNSEIVIAKLLPALAIGLFLGNLMVLAGIVIFKIPFVGSFILLEVALFFFILAIGSIGLCVSAVSNTQQQAILGCFAIAVPFILLSGFATPIANMPIILQYIAYLNPATHYLIIAQGSFLKAMPLEIIFQQLCPMIVVGLISLGSCNYLVKNKFD